MSQLDRHLSELVNSSFSSAGWIAVASLLSNPVMLPVALSVQAWGGGRRALRFAIAALIAAGIADFSAAKGWKPLFERPRPCHEGALEAPRGCGGPFGFPSNHASVAAAVAVAGWRGRRRDGAVVVLSVGVGLSRVVLGVHWLSDVLAGWGWGVLVGAALRCGDQASSE